MVQVLTLYSNPQGKKNRIFVLWSYDFEPYRFLEEEKALKQNLFKSTKYYQDNSEIRNIEIKFIY